VNKTFELCDLDLTQVNTLVKGLESFNDGCLGAFNQVTLKRTTELTTDAKLRLTTELLRNHKDAFFHINLQGTFDRIASVFMLLSDPTHAKMEQDVGSVHLFRLEATDFTHSVKVTLEDFK
jgi:hypothetical protein